MRVRERENESKRERENQSEKGRENENEREIVLIDHSRGMQEKNEKNVPARIWSPMLRGSNNTSVSNQ